MARVAKESKPKKTKESGEKKAKAKAEKPERPRSGEWAVFLTNRKQLGAEVRMLSAYPAKGKHQSTPSQHRAAAFENERDARAFIALYKMPAKWVTSIVKHTREEQVAKLKRDYREGLVTRKHVEAEVHRINGEASPQ